MSESQRERALKDLLRQAKTLAVRYHALTGKPFGVTGEVAEYEAAQKLRLTLEVARTTGYDAFQRANISHELAHIILEHPFTLPIDSTGFRSFDRDTEDEANWLGPVIPTKLPCTSSGKEWMSVRHVRSMRSAAPCFACGSTVAGPAFGSSGATAITDL